MDNKDLEYFDRNFKALDLKIESAKEEVQVVRADLSSQQQKHKAELASRIDGVRNDLTVQATESGKRWASVDKEMELHRQAVCPNMKSHLKEKHNVAKVLGLLVALMTIASIGAAGLVWLIQHAGVQ